MREKGYYFVKRIFDIIASLIGIIGTSPIWIIAIVGIYISDPGPIFYIAKRIGKNNKEFSMYKFRSMKQGTANESVFRGEEERIFPFGKFIRATKIDELPQLLCCLLGTMSIVGPRPAAKEQMKITRGGMYAKVSTVVPGLSGPAALYDYIYGDTVENEEEYKTKVLPTRLALELFYIYNHSALYDIKIIVYTVICVVLTTLRKEPKKIYDELLRSASMMDLENQNIKKTMSVQ